MNHSYKIIKKWTIILISIIVLSAIIRLIIISISVVGEGIHSLNSNGKYQASVNNFSKKLFCGGLEYWNEFVIINSKTGKTTKLIQQLEENEYFNWRTYGKIEFVHDSMVIIFIHKISAETSANNFELNIKLN